MELGDTAVVCTRRVIPAAQRTGKNYLIHDINDTFEPDGKIKDNLRYPTLTKFMDDTRANFNEAQSARDVFVIRLAEVYLIAAEAAMQTGALDKAADYVNVIRTRAAKPGQESAMEITTDQLSIDFILDERARELAGEQLRWFDLKRTGKLIDRVKRLNPENGVYLMDYHTVRPIPQTQLDAITNKEEFKQNPGYQ
jgi:hypothetical protein